VIGAASEVDNQTTENETVNKCDFTGRSEKSAEQAKKNKSIRLMIEKTNSAEAISGCVFPGEAGERTFPEVPDPKKC
jgi:hypothetical protein